MGAAVSLKFGILGLLAEQPLHGYDVKNRFESLLGGSWEVNFGQVYMTLQRLERDGLIEADGERGDRRKLAYRLTASGRKTLDDWLSRPESGPQQRNGSTWWTLFELASRRRRRDSPTRAGGG